MPTPTEIRTEITDRILDALKSGQAPWRTPWSSDPNAGFPTNVISNRPYRGINPLLLQVTSMASGHVSRWWATYKQWQELGGQVRRGEKGTHIVFYKKFEKEATADDDTSETKSIFFLRTYTVFNLDQVDGESLARFRPGQIASDNIMPCWENADEVIDATQADIRFGGNRAFYARPVGGDWPHHSDGDYIQLPHRHQFHELRDYYDTQFHELTHWSEVRRGWEGSYAMGELIAEMTAAFISAELQIPQSEDLSNHAKYLSSWLESMASDPQWILKAAQQACKAADFILSFRGLTVAESLEMVEAISP